MRVGMDYITNIEKYKIQGSMGSASQNAADEARGSKTTMKDNTNMMQEKAIVEAIEKLEGQFDNEKREYQFVVHEKTKDIMIKVIDPASKEVLKEFPSEQILDMVAKMCELAGIFVDEKR